MKHKGITPIKIGKQCALTFKDSQPIERYELRFLGQRIFLTLSLHRGTFSPIFDLLHDEDSNPNPPCRFLGSCY